MSVIVTSSASAGVYLERHVANLRLGMVLELFTASGALVGGLVAFLLPTAVLEGLFAALLAWVAVSMIRRREPARVPAQPVPVPGAEGAVVMDDPPVEPTFTDVAVGRRLPRPAAAGGHGGIRVRRARVRAARRRRRDRQGAR